ncbi:unnamed protein product [Parnassius apollo]|uniref:(apollo) hypothetical protein n=1 Tax=Parnassius apollo TaxID=110799 RepID=A0A8S3WUX5_PARAO|nr:unnamed protein product [Parnassius apollo]
MSIAVEVKNVCKEKDEDISIEVLEVSLLSQQWKLTNAIAAPNVEAALIPRERIHYVFKAKRILEESNKNKLEYSYIKVGKRHAESVDDVISPPYSKFLVDSLPSVDDITETNYSVPAKKRDGLIQSMLVLRWKAYDKVKNRTAIGQHCLWMDCFTKALYREIDSSPVLPAIQLEESESKTNINDIEEKSYTSDVVIFRLEHSNYVNHNFTLRKLCLIPIVINIVNCYGVPVTVFIDMSKQQNRETTGELGWAGALSTGIEPDSREIGVNVTLEKFESRRVQVRALCAAPGTYVVGSAFTLTTVWGVNNRASTHFSNNASLLVVRQV